MTFYLSKKLIETTGTPDLWTQWFERNPKDPTDEDYFETTHQEQQESLWIIRDNSKALKKAGYTL